MAVWLRETGELDQAHARLLELAAEFPEDDSVSYQTAWIHDRLGLEAAAVPFYRRAIAGGGLSPDELRGATVGFGSTLRGLGRYAEAVAVLRRGAQQFPEDGAIAAFLAMALYNTGEHHEAMSLLLGLLAATSTDPGVQRYRKAVEHYAQDLDAVEDVGEEALDDAADDAAQ